MVSGYLLIICVCFTKVTAWWDEGHALVGEIARLKLESSQVAKLETILSYWEWNYPGLGSLAMAATWMDKIKCNADDIERGAIYCRGVPFGVADGDKFLYEWHFAERVYNPLSLDIPDEMKTGPGGSGEAYQSLRKAHDVLKRPEGGSPFELNLALRVFLHVWGDMHQPLHACSTVSRWFSKTDKKGNVKYNLDVGGNRIKIVPVALPAPKTDSVDNLHKLWDAAGGAFPYDLPPAAEFGVANLTEVAERLMTQVPEEKAKDKFDKSMDKFFGDTSKDLDFTQLVQETFGKCQNEVWPTEMIKEMKRKDAAERNFYKDPLALSEEYIEATKYTSSLQLAKAGYRLARFLALYADTLPDLTQKFPVPPSPAAWEELQAAAAASAKPQESADADQQIPTLPAVYEEPEEELAPADKRRLLSEEETETETLIEPQTKTEVRPAVAQEMLSGLNVLSAKEEVEGEAQKDEATEAETNGDIGKKEEQNLDSGEEVREENEVPSLVASTLSPPDSSTEEPPSASHSEENGVFFSFLTSSLFTLPFFASVALNVFFFVSRSTPRGFSRKSGDSSSRMVDSDYHVL
uniref:Aspergillus nuclease S(1) n=1 Tax=Chromera velia CCMP2878 TaxID=1169474 RepID=A0A0G4HK24_9ALVE|mmetsp:Transcript_33782/g.66880  ORF Transcript_33782/g.66880 Transcript_33782/m.66880 type:complete len:578 (+) Transcript_33782:174-1907(+)|eukprot:Cvel_7143.t1-p1 / transcript=Cvel_7143.t1 / gene=Cvel_7143 / organism=Chromera_velia_CCMP2878 / gene_product=hypothetical protein / transcript_product=hypothetical protein / location=Cvel_scaffold367:9548-16136(+) / protein_length=577 / sequence_SO=supercontig / SO=protein_coding / is_pseudo=false